MGFDIDYLLFLQMLRQALGGALDEVFNALSKFAVSILPVLPYVIFWGTDKSWGYRFMTTLWSGELLNGVIKLTVCAYRPWIRCDLIEPAGDSKVAATGYSFPSGHTMCATALYGTTAVWQYAKRRWVSAVCGILIVLTGFSRNFLGVHTPQDVAAAITEMVLVIIIVSVLSDKLKGNEKTIDRLTFAGVPLVILALVYITLKPYPMDYVDGVLLVNPQVMMNDMFKAAGGFSGFLIGSYIERHYIHYEIPYGSRRLPLLTCIGAGVIYAWNNLFIGAICVPLLGAHWGNMLGFMITVLFALVLYPLIIRRSAQAERAETVSIPVMIKETEPVWTGE